MLYQFLIDGEISQYWSPQSTWIWNTIDANPRSYQIEVQIRDGKHAQPDSYDAIMASSFLIEQRATPAPMEPPVEFPSVPSSALPTNDLFFYNDAGRGAVGHIDADGKFQMTDPSPTFSSGWSEIVPIGSDWLFFYNNDGTGAVGYIDANNRFNQTDSSANFGKYWSKIIPAGPKQLFFYKDGVWATENIDKDGKFQPSYSRTTFSIWSEVVPIGSNRLFFYNDGGTGAVGHIDADGKLQMTDPSQNLSSGWSEIVPVGSDWLFFYNVDGTGAVGIIDDYNRFNQTDSSTNFGLNWSKIISLGSKWLFFYTDGVYAVLEIDENGWFRNTDDSLIDDVWSKIIPVGSNRLFFYNDDGTGAVGYIDADGNFYVTDSLTDLPRDWSIIVPLDLASEDSEESNL